jgi:hypothetical protein
VAGQSYRRPNGALPADQANLVAAQYLRSAQSNVGAEPEEWVKLDEQTWEHTKWLTGARLERLLDVPLERELDRTAAGEIG